MSCYDISKSSKPYRDYQKETREKLGWLQMYRQNPENYPDVTQEQVEKTIHSVEEANKLKAKLENINIFQFAKLTQYALSVRDEDGKFVELNVKSKGDTYTFDLKGEHSHVKITAKDTPDMKNNVFARLIHANYKVLELAGNEDLSSKEDRFNFDVREVGFEILSNRLNHYKQTGEIEPWDKYIMTAPEKEA